MEKGGGSSGLEKDFGFTWIRNRGLCRYALSVADSDSFFAGMVSGIHGSSCRQMDGKEMADSPGDWRRFSDWFAYTVSGSGSVEAIGFVGYAVGKSSG